MEAGERHSLLKKIEELESRLEESEQLIDSIKTGAVDAFAIQDGTKSEIYTLQTGDYAYRVLIEKFSEGALNVTEEGLIVYTNSYFFELLKLPYEQVIGHYIHDFVHPDSREEFNRIFAGGLEGKCKGEINLAANGTVVPVYISMTSLKPKMPTMGIIITDLSEKKKNDGIILKYQTDLERKNMELVQSNAELASFAYIASHDLQEPLRKIKAFSSKIMEKENDQLSENGKDYFVRMRNAVTRMQTLIEDILAYSRTNTSDRIFETVDLNKLLDEIKDELKEELQLRGAVIETGNLHEMNIIPFQFRQLLHNLISNALKFSSPDRKPRISISCRQGSGAGFPNLGLTDDSQFFHLSISDNGIGFEQQYSERIFEIFQRLHGKSEYKGTGIGLAIVKKIVENHAGIITATGKPGTGATFDIYLPVHANYSAA